MSHPPPDPPVGVSWGAYRPPAWYVRGHLWVHAAALTLLAALLLGATDRYQQLGRGVFPLNRPLLWAVVFFAVAVGKAAAARRYPTGATAAVVAGLTIFSWWTITLTVAALDHPPAAVGAVLTAVVVAEHFAALTLTQR